MRTMGRMAIPRIGCTCSTIVAGDESLRRLQVPEPYVRWVEEAGGLALILPFTDPSHVAAYLELVDGVLVIGGDDVDPSLYGAKPHAKIGPVDRPRDLFEIELVRRAVERDVPTFGICRGLQVMNVAFGGTLLQHVPEDVPGSAPHVGFKAHHPVGVVAGSRLAGILGHEQATVNSSHHQAIDRPASRLEVSARSPDGVVEAAEDPTHPFLLGVQWHPERMAGNADTRRLFHAFVAAAAARMSGKPQAVATSKTSR